MINIDYKTLCNLDIHSITFLTFKMGLPDGCLMVNVEQGMKDADKCRSTISHNFQAKDFEDAIPKIMARAKAIAGIEEILKLTD